jgi:hypothetical protein
MAHKLAVAAKALVDAQKWGISVVIINKGSFEKNCVESNRIHADIHIAMHTDAGGGHGTTVFYHPGSVKGAALAKALYPFIASASNSPDRGIKASNAYGELNQTNAPAVIVEALFHDNAKDASEMRKSIPEFALAYAKGIARYYGKVYKAPAVVVVPPVVVSPPPIVTPPVVVPPVVVPSDPVEHFLEARFHIAAVDRAQYAAMGAGMGDVVLFYPTPKDSWRDWPKGL